MASLIAHLRKCTEQPSKGRIPRNFQHMQLPVPRDVAKNTVANRFRAQVSKIDIQISTTVRTIEIQ